MNGGRNSKIRGWIGGIATVLLLIGVLEPLAAETAKDPKPLQTESDQPARRDHLHQGSINILIGTGWFLVAPYDKNDAGKMCERQDTGDGVEGEPVCTGRSGFFLDLLGGFGVLPGFEVYAIFRLGLERPGGDLVNQPKTRQLGAGIRLYSPKSGFFKIGFGIAPLFDFSDHGNAADVGKDFVIHVPIQAQFDIVRWFGAYAQVASNISFVSEFRLELTGGIGVQGRFP
ncbi:MAG: hypothetical protein QNJ97_20785 [Myxococcota bacterium]|nr:hypothetical protein [Myxococcota bacterium]